MAMSHILNRDFQTIQLQFLCCVPIKKIHWQESLQSLTWEEQEQFINKTVKLPELEKYPLQTKYVIRFLRHIIDVLEKQYLDVHDDFYTILCEHQLQSDDCNNSYSFKHYRIWNENGDSYENVILKENNNKISQGTTGLNVWESALVLSEWAIANKSYFRGKCVLELGAGTGLTSLVAGKCCDAKSIKVTDGNDTVIEILEENFANNFEIGIDHGFANRKSGTEIDIVKLDWGSHDLEYIIENFGGTNLIIAADIVYDNTLFHPLLTTVAAIFNNCVNCEQFLLVNAVRNPETEKEFLNMFADFSLEHSVEPTPNPKHFQWEQNDILPIKLYSIRPIRK